jgi:hypothetical protein
MTLVQRSSTGLITGTGFKNLLINPHMEISQRGVSFPLVPAGSFTLDRWQLATGTGGTCTVTQEAVPLADSGTILASNFLRINQTVGHSVEAIGGQTIESVKTAAGQNVTLSFWAKRGVNAISVRPDMTQNFGSGGGASSPVTVTGTVIPITSTSWAKYTQTFAIPSITIKTLGTNGLDYLLLSLVRVTNGSTYTLDITDVQLEIGVVATELERRPRAVELSMCHRYYEAGLYSWHGYASASSGVGTSILFKQTKRGTPSVSQQNIGTSSFTATMFTEEVTLNGFLPRRRKDGTSGSGAYSQTWQADAEL